MEPAEEASKYIHISAKHVIAHFASNPGPLEAEPVVPIAIITG